MSMHEQQESVSREVSHCLCHSPSDNMTSLKFIRVLEIQGQIAKNHLLRTCSVHLIFWSKNPSCSCKWTCSTKRAGNRPRSMYRVSIL